MTIIKRADLGRPLTWDELDDNFDQVDSLVSTAANAVQTATTQAQAASGFADTASTASQEAQDAAITAGSAASAAVAGIYSDFASTDVGKGASLVKLTTGRTVESKLSEFVSIMDFAGADPTGSTASDNAFISAEAKSNLIYVTGTFLLSSFIPTKFYFGPGSIITPTGSVVTVSLSPSPLNYSAPNTIFGASTKDIGTFNTLAGFNTGANMGPSAARNTLIGHNLASGDTIDPSSNAPFTGTDNVGAGYHALKKNQTGSNNVGFGRDALNENKTGNHNIAAGTAALQQVVDINDNVAIGGAALGRLQAGSGLNTTVGRDGGRENNDGTRNSTFGWGAGRGVTPTPATYTGDGTTTTFSAGSLTLTNVKQIRVDVNGINILPANYTVSGTNVIFNTAPASGAAIVLTYTIGNASYSYSTYIGARTGYLIKSGNSNTTVGDSAGYSLSLGSNNLCIGVNAGQNNDGSGNVLIGPNAGSTLTSTSNRLIIHNAAGTTGLINGFFDTSLIRFNGSLQFETDVTWAIGSATRKAIATYSRDYYVGSAGTVKILSGTGSPEGSQTAPVSSIYLRSDGTTGTLLYIKQTGTGNTGWAAIA